jgi:allantoinase
VTRDLKGYGRTPPHAQWPGGARVAVSFVINFEEGAEMSLSAGDAFNEKVYEVTDEISGVADRCMESHFEYGTKAAWWRIADTLQRLGVATTVSTCGKAAELSPWLIEDAVRRGHEISCHGWRWERQVHMAEAEERRVIARTVRTIGTAAGAPPVGWHTRSATSVNTRRLLMEHGGFLYDSNAYNDDLPFMHREGNRDLVILPYAFDTNDMRFQRGGGFVFGDDFARYCIDAFDRLYEEGAEAPRMMSVGLHLRIIGRPGRIGGLERFLAHAASKPGVWFARRDAIARHWLAALGKS